MGLHKGCSVGISTITHYYRQITSATTATRAATTQSYKRCPYKHLHMRAHIQAATDAGANDTDATVGGWYSTLASPHKHEVHWFPMPITKHDHPWAYTRETPKQSIAAIELYATLLLLKHITTNSTLINMTLPLRTDNMGNSYTSTDFKCKKWPNSAILMEIALVQHHQRMRLDLQHVHRENNQWSDQLTHSDFNGFNEQLRFQPNTDYMQWYLLDKLPMFENLSPEPTVPMRAVS